LAKDLPSRQPNNHGKEQRDNFERENIVVGWVMNDEGMDGWMWDDDEDELVGNFSYKIFTILFSFHFFP
jgi:hypothetical protein